MPKPGKTNAMRLLEAAKIPFAVHEYDPELTDGNAVAAALGQDPFRVFKTLVTTGASGEHYVFAVPVNAVLNLKKAAKAVGEKSIEMLKQRDLLPLTGYIHGGCSPVGMKKAFPTVFDETAQLFETLTVSAGRRGFQIEIAPETLCRIVGGKFADLTE